MRRSAAWGVVGGVVGALAALAIPALAANVNSGTYSMKAGTSLNVTCPNTLSNSGISRTGETVNCAAAAPTTTTQPPSTTTPPTTQPPDTTTTPPTTQPPDTTTTAPSGGGGSVTCETAATNGECRTSSGFVLTNDGWNSQAGETYDLKDYDGSEQNWTDTVSANPCSCVSAYPSVEAFTAAGAGNGGTELVSAYPSITGSWAETMNPNAGSVTHAMYDIWTGPTSNVWRNETAVVVDFTANDPGCDTGANHGTYTDPLSGRDFTFCGGTSGERQFYLQGAPEPVGQFDILAALKWEQANGFIPTTDVLGEVDFGWEILSTGSQPQTLAITGYTLSGFTPVLP